MKKKIAVLGSTGSIGKSTLSIFAKDKKNFSIDLLTTNKNIKLLHKQIKKFHVKYIIIHEKKVFEKYKKYFSKKKIYTFNSVEEFKNNSNIKFDYVMCSISGINGLKPTLNIIERTKEIAIANKETIICAWNLIQKEIKKNNVKFLPIDSEHFSIWELIKNENYKNIDKIFLTASGGPFLNYSIKNFSKITPSLATNHPNWKMGKKISIDSATLMNKVYEIIEAKNIFNLDYNKISAIIHPSSYVHTLIKFNNGLIKLLIHDTSMKIPIFNTIYKNNEKKIFSQNVNFNKLNNLMFKKIDVHKFPAYKILKYLPKNISLFETVIVSANDELVDLFLKKKIQFKEIAIKLKKIAKMKEFNRYKKIKPKKITDILILNNYVRLKIRSLSV